MEYERSRLIAPRNVVNSKMIYGFYALKELSKGKSLFGNMILEKFKEEFSDANMPFPVSSSTVYETLYTLEKNGYVTSSWDGDEFLNKRSKKYYRITDEGIKYYKSHIGDYVANINKTKAALDKIVKLIM